jgi:Spy/CpxP family protein refolding chaperone
MSRTLLIAAIFCCLIPSGDAAGGARQPPPPDPIGENLFPPDLLLRHQQEIGLTGEQRGFVEAELRKAQTEFARLQQQLQREMAAMGDLLKQERPAQQETLAQLDKVLEAERQIKRAHLALALAIRNKLTREQQARLGDIKRRAAAEAQHRGPEGDVPEPLRAKMRQVQQRVGRWQAEGRDLSPVGHIMQEVDPLMRERKFAEAARVLDRALKLLEADAGPDDGNDGDVGGDSDSDSDSDSDRDPGSGEGEDKRPDVEAGPPGAALTPEALRNEIEALRPAEHAWRKIPWKDCPLEALAESRRRGKPVIAWVFLGSPGTERC